MRFSQRLDAFASEVFASLNAQRRALEAQGRTMVDLSVGTPDFTPPAYAMEALEEAARDPELWKYSLHVEPQLLDAFCAYYEKRFGVRGLTPQEVTLVSGTQEGMAHLAMALVDEGDTVLVPDPCYPIFEGSARLAGATPVYYPMVPGTNFLPDLDGIAPEVARAASYIVVSLPANPVGSVAPAGFYEKLIAWARTYDVLVVHDNAYSDIMFDGNTGQSFLAYPGAKEVGVEFYSLSKSFNVTGARLSFLSGRQDVVAALIKLRGQFDFGTFLPLQRVALACLTSDRATIEPQRKGYEARRDALANALEAIGWERPQTHGTMFVWAKLPARYPSSFAFVSECMEQAGVVVTPGAAFGPAGEGYVRFALVRPPAELAAAVEAMGAAGFGA
jgi:LL-diaminopimelate aminotransferase